MTKNIHSAHRQYVLHAVKTLCKKNDAAQPRILDFGSGAGEFMAYALSEELDIYGADPYPNCDGYRQAAEQNPLLSGSLNEIKNGKIDYPDNHFDIVVSNMVFEHVQDIHEALSEVCRVLKPNGYFLALFPTKDVWWEGHVYLWFVHWFPVGGRLQKAYLSLMHRLGQAKENKDMTRTEWVECYHNYFPANVFYRHYCKIRKLWEHYFNDTPLGLEDQYMIFRLKCSSRFSKFVTYP